MRSPGKDNSFREPACIKSMLRVAVGVVFVIFSAPAEPADADQIERIISTRQAYIEHFRIHGERDSETTFALEQELTTLAESSSGKLEVQALYELATIKRLTNQFDSAIRIYQGAAAAASVFGLDDLVFDAWLGVARSHVYGSRNHSAAAEAFRQATRAAGTNPTRKQAYEMADYASHLETARGELEAALISAIEAVRLAAEDAELFYAQLDVGDVLQKFAESCDYRPLVDAKTVTDREDSWGACRRAVVAAKSYYQEATKTARRLGWNFLAKEAEGFSKRLDLRLFLIEQKARFEKLSQAGIFCAQDVRDVLVNKNFAAGGSELTDVIPLVGLIDEVVPDSGVGDPRSLYLLGIKADMEGSRRKALAYYERAVDLLLEERSTLFDPRNRGTVIENRPELVRDLGLRLLSLGDLERAFQAFESIRSRGLSQLAAAYEGDGSSANERRWLADVVNIESQQSAILNELVKTTIAGIEHSKSVAMIAEMDQLEQRRVELLEAKEFRGMASRLKTSGAVTVTIQELQRLSKSANIPVVFYWVYHTNVLVWIVSPRAITVNTVFFPEVVVIDKVRRFVESISEEDRTFDGISARELHTYLISPFGELSAYDQILIVPQGPLLTLPFEALIDAKTGRFLVEDTAVSYAPNAYIAARALRDQLPKIDVVTALYDESIEHCTGEVGRIRDETIIRVEGKSTKGMTVPEALRLLDEGEVIHLLMHGEYNNRDPLQSRLQLRPNVHEGITAAELLLIDWRGTRLAVFSSCESARLNLRISNEVYGLAWAPLVGGVDHVILTRWKVLANSHAEWMVNFYSKLASGECSPALAAAASMRSMISGNCRHPFFWAGPQVFGR